MTITVDAKPCILLLISTQKRRKKNEQDIFAYESRDERSTKERFERDEMNIVRVRANERIRLDVKEIKMQHCFIGFT